jgi:hypothetical protein
LASLEAQRDFGFEAEGLDVVGFVLLTYESQSDGHVFTTAFPVCNHFAAAALAKRRNQWRRQRFSTETRVVCGAWCNSSGLDPSSASVNNKSMKLLTNASSRGIVSLAFGGPGCGGLH